MKAEKKITHDQLIAPGLTILIFLEKNLLPPGTGPPPSLWDFFRLPCCPKSHLTIRLASLAQGGILRWTSMICVKKPKFKSLLVQTSDEQYFLVIAHAQKM